MASRMMFEEARERLRLSGTRCKLLSFARRDSRQKRHAHFTRSLTPLRACRKKRRADRSRPAAHAQLKEQPLTRAIHE